MIQDIYPHIYHNEYTPHEPNPEDIVLIIDETHGKPLAIGISLITGEEMVKNDSGKAIETKHYVGDDIWNFEL